MLAAQGHVHEEGAVRVPYPGDFGRPGLAVGRRHRCEAAGVDARRRLLLLRPDAADAGAAAALVTAGIAVLVGVIAVLVIVAAEAVP